MSRAPKRRASAAFLAAEIVLGLSLLGCAALGGIFFVRRPWPNRLDVEGFKLLPAAPNDHVAQLVASLGSLRVLLVVAACCFVLSVFRDWARALACAVGPVAAVLVTERIAKPLVARHVTAFGGNSYPSGTVTAVAALVVAIVLIAPRLLRPYAFLGGLVVVAAVSVAVVVLRWHFPTDALGGALVGSGSTLFFDGLFHVPAALAAPRYTAAPEVAGFPERVLETRS